MASAVIVDAVRSPCGLRHGGLSGWHAADLAGEVLRALVERTGVDPGLVEHVILGCATQVGHQALNLGRSAVLAAGWPDSVPATTVDLRCASSQQAVHFAAQGVLAGVYEVVVAAGVEVMTTTPAGSAIIPGSTPFGPDVLARYRGAGGLVPPGTAAEAVADAWRLDRDDLDAYAAESHLRAARAVAAGHFRREVVPVAARAQPRPGHPSFDGGLIEADEGVGGDATRERLSLLKPMFKPDGRVTAGNSAPVSDAAAAVLISSEEAAARHGLTPRARFVSFAVAGVDPVIALTGALPATAMAFARAGLDVDDVDRFEVDELFASVALAWQRRHQADPARVNVGGGAIALGHPAGAAGARLATTLVHELERSGGRYGLQAMSGTGGVGTATVVECLT